MENGKLDPVIVSSCMVEEDETSKNQVKSITDMVRYVYYVYLSCPCYHVAHFLVHQIVKLKHRLNRWREVTAWEFPDRPDLLELIPTVDKSTSRNLRVQEQSRQTRATQPRRLGGYLSK